MQQGNTLKILPGLLALIFILQSVTIALAQVVKPVAPIDALSDNLVKTVEATATIEPTPEPTATMIPLDQQKQMDLGTLVVPAKAPGTLTEDEIEETVTTLDDVYRMQSGHPYTGNTKKIIKVYLEGASELAVRFDGSFGLENGYDTLGLYLPSETEGIYRLWNGKTYTGTDLANETKVVEGDTLVVRFESDESVEAYGWKIIEIVPKVPDLTPDSTVEESISEEPAGTEEATDEPVIEEPDSTEESLELLVNEEEPAASETLEASEETVDTEEKKQQAAEADETLRANKLPATMTLYDVDVNCEGNVACMTSGEGYGSSLDEAKWLRSTDGNALEVSFADTSNTEKYFDQVGIYGLSDEAGIYELIGNRSYSGEELSGLVVTVPGNEVIVRLISDESIEKDGWAVADVSVVDLLAEALTVPVVISTITPLLTEEVPISFGANSGEGAMGYFIVDPNLRAPEPLEEDSDNARAIPAPAITNIFKTTYNGKDCMHITWTAVTNATGYRLWVSTKSADYGFTDVFDISNYTGLYYYPTNPNQTYYFRVAAVVHGEIGTISAAAGGRINIGIPSLYLSKIANTKHLLSWTSIGEATGYRLYRSETSPTSDFTWAKDFDKVTSCIVSDLNSTKTYYYKVSAIIHTMEGPVSSVVTGSPSAPLASPTLTVSKVNTDYFKLSWNPILGATGYRIWRSETSATSGYSWVTNVGNITSVVTKAPTKTKTYYYRVAAMEESVIGQLSEPIPARVLIDQPTMNVSKLTGTQVHLSWNPISGATGYRIWRSEISGTSGFNWVVTTPGTMTATITNVPDSTKTYYYRVAAMVGTILGPLSVPGKTGPTPLDKPTLNTPTVVDGNSFSLSWSTVSGATGYRLYRSETSPTSGYTWTTNTGNVTTFVTLAPDMYKSYYYRVVAINGSQTSALSNFVIAQVNPTKYRAVLVGNSYAGTPAELVGTIPDATQMQNTLRLFKNGDERYVINRYSDLSRADTLSNISAGFAGADASDVSLFYYAGHGGSENSGYITTDVYLLGNDNQKITVTDLKSVLDTIPGQKIVIIDACHSGGFIAKNGNTVIEESEEFNPQAFVSAFTSAFADGSRTLDKPGYVVMAAARSDQYSYEMDFGGGNKVGVFTYYLLRGMGWNYTGGIPYDLMSADKDNNSSLTFVEAFDYAHAYAETFRPQTAQMYPVGYQGFFYAR